MKLLLSPAMAWIIRLRNNVKLPMLALLFTVPLAIAAIAQPFTWGSWTGAAIIATYALAWYLGAAHYYSADEAWKIVRSMASLLNERDLRSTSSLLSREEVRGKLGSGQFTQLYSTLADAHDSLRKLVEQARASSNAASQAADELASGNVNLSARSEEQASTLEQTAASMEELSATIKENAESCRAASDLAGGATQVARNGAQVAQSAVDTMDLIERSAKRIADIIGVIDGIAFQTNILALNAAVEAARAGEQGRGFAVVASEVRSLAQRSAQAAKEIKSLISESVSSVNQGTRLVHDAGRIIGEVTSSVEQVNELIGVIAVASREQSNGVEGVNRALTQLQGVTQQNASVVQEAAFASVTLKEESARLAQLVGGFKLDQAAAPASAHAPRAAARTPLSRPAQSTAPRLAHVNKAEWEQF